MNIVELNLARGGYPMGADAGWMGPATPSGMWPPSASDRGGWGGGMRVPGGLQQMLLTLLQPLQQDLRMTREAALQAAQAPAQPRPERQRQMGAEQWNAVKARINEISSRWENGARDVGGWNDRERHAIGLTKASALRATEFMTYDQAMATLAQAEANGWGANVRTFEDGAWTQANDYLSRTADAEAAAFQQRVTQWEQANGQRLQQAQALGQQADRAAQTYATAMSQVLQFMGKVLRYGSDPWQGRGGRAPWGVSVDVDTYARPQPGWGGGWSQAPGVSVNVGVRGPAWYGARTDVRVGVY